MLISTPINKGIEDAVGKPVRTSDGVLVGTVVTYDKETGIAVLDIDKDYWNKIKLDVATEISSRSLK